MTKAQLEILQRACARTEGYDAFRVYTHGLQQRTIDALAREGMIEQGYEVLDTAQRGDLMSRRNALVAAAEKELHNGDWEEAFYRLHAAKGLQADLDSAVWRVTDAGKAVVTRNAY